MITADTGAGSLRQAIEDVGPSETITFDASLAGQTITLASELVTTKSLTIDASALSTGITLSGGGVLPGEGTQRIIRVLATHNVTLRGLRLFNGSADVATNNGHGGGIFNGGTTVVDRCTFIGNKTAIYGGAIFNNFTSMLTVTNSTFSQNSSTNFGAAISSFGVLVVEGSTFHANSAYQGGGIYSSSSSTLTATNSTFTANNAQDGGAIFNGTQDIMRLFSVTIVQNTAVANGGGIYNDFLGENTNSEVTNSIVALNTAPTGSNIFGGYQSINNLIGGDPKLSPLGDFGGPTQTMRPLPDSPAIDMGGTTTLSTDQRGQPRILVDGLDLGAVEVPFSDFNTTGVTIHTRVPTLDSDGHFEISTDPDFLPTVTTYAGKDYPANTLPGRSDGPRLSAELNNPAAVARDSQGGVFFSDAANNRICMIGTDGQVVTIAGTGGFGLVNGAGATAQFKFPAGLAVGPDNNVYVADTFNHCIRKLTRPAIAGGAWAVSTFVGSGISGFQDANTLSAKFSFPYGLAIDATGIMYVADSANHRIRRVDADGVVTTYSGTGVRGANNTDYLADPIVYATFDFPKGVVLLSGSLYVADTGNHMIRKIVLSDNPLTRDVTTFAGSTTPNFVNAIIGTNARFSTPSGIATDGVATLYVADEGNHSIRKIIPSGEVSTVAGTDVADMVNGKTDIARFDSPTGVAVGLDGNLIVADTKNHMLRGVAIQPLSVLSSLATDVSGVDGEQVSYVLDVNALGLAPGVVYYFRWKSTLTGDTQLLGQSFFLYDFPVVETKPASNVTPSGAQLNATVDPKNGRTIVTLEYSTDPNLLKPYRVSTTAGSGVAGFADDTGTAAQFSNPSGVVTNADGDVFVADRLNHRIRKITAAGVVTTFAGSGVKGFADGPDTSAQFEEPTGLAIDGDGNLYVADAQNHSIRMITPAGVVSTFAGSGIAGHQEGAALSARFLYPTGVAVDASGNVFVADSGNHRIRVIADENGTDTVSTYAGTGVLGMGLNNSPRLDAQFKFPKSLTIGAGNAVVVADTGNHRICVIEPNTVTTLAGNGSEGFVNGPGANAQFSSPEGITRDADGVYYVTDTGNHRIRSIAADGSLVSNFAGSGIAGHVDSPTAELHPITASHFNLPLGITVHADGTIYVTQQGLLRKIARSATLPSVTVVPDADGNGPRDLFAAVNLPLRYGTTYYFRARGTSYRDSRIGEILSFATTQAMQEVFDGASTSALRLYDQQAGVVNFGSTPTGQPVPRSFTIFNPGTAPLTVSSVVLPDGFQLSGSFGVIDSEETATADVILTATTAGSYGGEVVITSDAQEQQTFTFSITGLVLDPPVVTTLAATDVAATSATFNAIVNPKGSSTTVWFEWSQDPDFDGVNVGTLAGTSAGLTEGAGNIAQFNQPSGLAMDADGNTYVADTENHRIRKIEPDGTTSTFAGGGTIGDFVDGERTIARFNRPVGIVINSNGVLFVSDSGNHRIRAITPEGVVSTFSGLGTAGFTDGLAGAARFSSPSGLAIDASGLLYVADTGNHRVRKVATNGDVSTLAGTGTASFTNGTGDVAEFSSPTGIARDTAGYVYLTEATSHAIRRIASDGTTITFAGSVTLSGYTNASGTTARFINPVGLGITVNGSILVADKGNHRIRSISTAGLVTTVAGSGTQGVLDGLGDIAQFSEPSSLAIKADGGFVVGEVGSSVVREIDTIQVLVQAVTGLTGTDILAVSLPVTGLPSSGAYYYRAIATNGGGTIIGNTVTENAPAPTGFVAWQSTYFGADADDPLIAGPCACPAGDGVANLLKYAFGLTPPQESAAGEMPTADLDGSSLSITYTKVHDATDIIYTVEWSSDLVNWYTTDVTEEVVVEIPDPDPASEQIIATVTASPATAKFLRVKVTQQP